MKKDSIFYLDSLISHENRHFIGRVEELLILALIFAPVIVKFFGIDLGATSRWGGFLLIFISMGLGIKLAEMFYVSLRSQITSGEFWAGKIFYEVECGRRKDFVSALFKSGFGKKLASRLEIGKDDVKKFLADRKIAPIADFSETDIKSAVLFVFEKDESFRNFLASYNVDKITLLGALDWIIFELDEEFAGEKWWTREALSKIRGIAKDWSFGQAYNLMQYARNVADFPEMREKRFDITERVNEVRQIENVLLKQKEANVVLVGDPGAGTMDIIYDFERRILDGKVSPFLEHKRIYSLNFDLLVSATKQKAVFEAELIKILNEAVQSGNIILLIEDLPSFISSAQSLGSNLSGILGRYLDSALQIIITADPQKFHQHVETNSDLIRRFERINVVETDEKETLTIIEAMLREIEPKGVKFSYPAILEMVRGASQYFSEKAMPDGAIDLLFEIMGSISGKFVSRNDILNHLGRKTNIPLGEIDAGEKEKLLNLEAVLHERVIGQREAISSISSAMRRARANIRNMKKPIGSFLFLGPTGVGKTETAKALTQVFFGDEKFMLRLDMTEYQERGSIERLIGSFGLGKAGVLSNMLRENPYGVLLLDEFEKADKDTQNLFLQILDEGFFSDMNGKKVSARNLIIIATSNAASQYIFDIVRGGGDPNAKKDELIAKIVQDGTYRPELLNRFDATVIFRPLSESELKQVAALMLKKFQARLRDKGIEMVVDDFLIGRVAKLGSNEIFGARPMNRFIQERIEEPIAKKMISGVLRGGSKYAFKESDF